MPACLVNDSSDTKASLLDAAEALFAELGFAGASLRAITARADVNIAAAHYHFGSKESLLRAVVARRLRPVNRARLEHLDRLEAAVAGSGRTPSLISIVEAFLGPVLTSCATMPDGGRTFAQLLGRVLMGHDERLRAILHDELTEVISRFVPAFGAALPHLSDGELLMRIHFMVGALAHTVGGRDMLSVVFKDRLDVDNLDAMARGLVDFVTAGLSAPASQTPVSARPGGLAAGPDRIEEEA